MKRTGYLASLAFLIAWGLVLLTGTSFARVTNGGLSDGGGNLVVCFDSPEIPKAIRTGGGEILGEHIPHISFLEAFDLYEAKLKRGFGGKRPELTRPRENETFLDYARRIQGRLKETIPGLADILQEGADSFPDANIILDDHGLRKIDDVNASGLIDSVNCVLGTAIAQYKINDQHFLHIDERLFFHEKHSEWSKGVLLLHEFFYLRGRELGQTDSRSTRTLVSAIISNDRSATLYKTVDLAMALGFLENREKGDFEHYAYARPIADYWESLWWLRIKASMAFDDFEYHLPPGVTDSYTLLSESVEILAKVGVESQAHSVSSAYATLRNVQARFSRLKEPKKAEELMAKLERYLEERAKSVEAVTAKHIADWQPKLNRSYLTEPQNDSISSALRRVAARMLNFARDYKTPAQLDWCRNRINRGGIVFDTDVGVCEFADFSMSIDLLNRERCDLRIKGANEWLRAHARHALFFDEHYQDWADQIPFPVLD